MTTQADRKALWDALLEADYQRRYWHSKAAAFIQVDRVMQIFLAVLSSAAVLSALGDLKLLVLWKWLSAATAIVATVLPFMNYTRRSVAMTEVGSKWHELEIEYSSMWRTIEKDGFCEQRFKELKAKEVDIGKATAELPTDDKKLQKECYKQVLISRGVQNDITAS